MRGGGRHQRHRHGRGRPFKSPFIENPWQPKHEDHVLELFDYELEALRLVDLESLTQEEAANAMKPPNDTLSRGNIYRYLQSARKKVITALLHSKSIKIVIINTQKYEDSQERKNP